MPRSCMGKTLSFDWGSGVPGDFMAFTTKFLSTCMLIGFVIKSKAPFFTASTALLIVP